MSQDKEVQHRLWQAKQKIKSLSNELQSCFRVDDAYGDQDENIERVLDEIAEAGYDYWAIKKQQQGCCQCECTKDNKKE